MMQWRRLTCAVPTSFLVLPLGVRGVFQELKRYCDDLGQLEIGDEVAGLALARMMSAHPSEYVRVRAAVDLLIERKFLRLESQAVVIVGFEDDQAGPMSNAERQAKHRAKRYDRVTESNEAPLRSTVTNVTTEEKRGEEKRSPPVGETGPPARSAAKGKPKREPKAAPNPLSGSETPEQVTWRIWRETYAASGRKYGPYVSGGACPKVVKRVAEQACKLLNERDGYAPTEAIEALLRHWFKAYLRDDGQRNFLAEQRHALQFFERGIPTYGAPWSKPQKPANVVETMPEPTHERRIVRPEAKPDGVPAPAGLMDQFRLIGGQR